MEPPDYPGKVTGAQGGDHEIAKNAAIQQSVTGWDWIRGTPDRNTGLWDRVSLKFTDSTLFVQDVHVRTLTNITSRHPPHVDIGVTAHLRYNQAQLLREDMQHYIVITATVLETLETSSLRVQLKDLICAERASEHCETMFDLPPIRMSSPSTWWPHNYGDPHLYRLKVSVQGPCSKSMVRSEHLTRFGVRTFTTFVDPLTEGRVFLCNGVKLFLQGGNWIFTDQFHRFSTSRARYANEIQLHKSMGLNIIRVWGGGITERPEFYHVADELGMLVWQELWMTGDNNGRWAGSYNDPLNHNIYLACAKDTILMLRNHASLLLWVGGNELYPAGKSPPRDIAVGLASLISELDSGRFYIPSSMSNYTNYDPSFALAPKDGPYGFLKPSRFYQRNPGLRYWNGTLAESLKLGFQPEIGSSSTPTYRGIKHFLTDKDAEVFPDRNGKSVPSVFEYHNYQSYTDDGGHDHIYAYGTPANMSEYCFQAQLAQYAQFKGLFEGYQRYMWRYYTAMLFWKTQSPWPSFRGFMYDYWLETTGGYWGVRAALEGGQPYHVQLGNWTTNTSVVIVNRSPHSSPGTVFSVLCQWWDLNGTLLESGNYTYDVDGSELAPSSVHSLKTSGLTFPTSTSLGIAYLRLVMYSQNNTLCTCRLTSCSFNDYFLSNPEADQDFTELGKWRNDPSRLLDLNVSCVDNDGSALAVQVTNPGTAIALQIRIRKDDATEMYFYSDQYFSLLPSESLVVTMNKMHDEVSTMPLDIQKMIFAIDGLNVKPRYLECERSSAAKTWKA